MVDAAATTGFPAATCESIVEILRTTLCNQSSVPSGKQQVWIGIAGSPGSGKSTLASSLCELCNKKRKHGCNFNEIEIMDLNAIVVPMDGYHYCKSELEKFENREEAFARRGIVSEYWFCPLRVS